MFWRFMARFRPLVLVLAGLFFITACEPSAQSAATMTPPPAFAPPTATTTPPPTAAPPTTTVTPPPIAALTSTPVIEIDLDMELPAGDPQRSLSRAIQFHCAGCHNQGAFGPRFDAAQGLPSILERGELRIADPAYEGSAATNREYIIESVFLPEVYVVPGDWPEAMPTNYADSLTEQDLADILVWIAAFE